MTKIILLNQKKEKNKAKKHRNKKFLYIITYVHHTLLPHPVLNLWIKFSVKALNEKMNDSA